MAECSGSRFKPLDKPIEEYITNQENKNTRAKTQRDVKLLTAFLLEKNEQRKIEEIQPEELNRHVSEFILSVKRKDGQDNEPSSLRGLFSSFNRYLMSPILRPAKRRSSSLASLRVSISSISINQNVNKD